MGKITFTRATDRNNPEQAETLHWVITPSFDQAIYSHEPVKTLCGYYWAPVATDLINESEQATATTTCTHCTQLQTALAFAVKRAGA